MFKRIIPLLLIVLFGSIGYVFIYLTTIPIPDLKSFEDVIINQTIKVTDRNGELLHNFTGGEERRRFVSLEIIPQHMIDATTSIEDHLFYQHKGVRPLSILSALLENIQNGETVRGGSTITQQLIKNILLTKDQNITRKLKELVLSLKIEQTLTKDEIIELYLNSISYGSNTIGIAEASQLFFNKEPKNLTIAESAYLAALPKAPGYYSPYGKNKVKLDERKDIVLKRMFELKKITKEDYEESIKEWVVFKPRNISSIKAPHFVFFVLDEMKDHIDAHTGGVIQSTLDYPLQKEIEDIVKKNKHVLEKAGAQNISVTILDVTTGDILAMLGSFDYFNDAIEGKVNIATSQQQPGSTFKPFIYAAAFEQGYSPETLIFDARTQFSTYCEPDELKTDSEEDCYAPENYTQTYKGVVSLREALAQSINVPTIKTAYLTRLENIEGILRKTNMFSTEDIYRHGLPIAIGSSEVQPLKLTNAYSIFANDGNFVPFRSVLSITNKNIQKTIGKNQSIHILSKQTTDTINDILVDDKARGTVFGTYPNGTTPLYFPNRSVALKTGTTNNNTDIWIVGYNKNIVVSIWAGNSDNTPNDEKSSGSMLATILKQIFNSEEIKKYKTSSFDEYIKKFSDKENNINESILKKHSALYAINKRSPLIEHWEYGVKNWIDNNAIRIPTTQVSQNKIIIEEKTRGHQTVVSFLPLYQEKITHYEIYINNKLKNIVYQSPYIIDTTTIGRTLTLQIIGITESGNKLFGEKTIQISSN